MFVFILSILISFVTENQNSIQVKEEASKEMRQGSNGLIKIISDDDREKKKRKKKTVQNRIYIH